MVEIDEAVQDLITHPVRPLTSVDLLRRRAADKRRNRWSAAVCTVVILAGTTLVLALSSRHSPSQHVQTGPITSAPGGSGSTSTPVPASPLAVQLLLDATTVKSGGVLSGTIEVTNNTGHQIQATGCGTFYHVVLAGPTRPTAPPSLQCLQTFTIRPGSSRFPVQIKAATAGCGEGTAGAPACRPTGPPPLAPGHYQAWTFMSDPSLPTPIPVSVTVTP